MLQGGNFGSENTLPERGSGLGSALPTSSNNQTYSSSSPMLAAEVMLPVVIQDKLGNVTDRQNIPTRVTVFNTGGLMG